MREKDISEADVFTVLVVNFIHYMIYLTSDVVWVCDRFCEVIRRSLEEEVRRREEEEVRKLLGEASKHLRKLSEEEVESIRKSGEER